MAKGRKNTNKSAWAKLGSGRMPVNTVAARVIGHGARKPAHVELLQNARKEKDPAKRSALMKAAVAAKVKYESRLVGSSAEAKARAAMERAAWRRANDSGKSR